MTHTPSLIALNVVLIDDHADSREMAAEVMRMAGFEVLEFASAEEALESIALNVPDAIVTDISLPGMDGREVAIRVKGEPRTKHVPLIAVTGRSDALDNPLFDS